jgi:fatty acid desaturase
MSEIPDIRTLSNSKGVTYVEFRKKLKLKQTTVIKNLVIPWFMIAIQIIIFFILRKYNLLSFLIIFPASLWISFWMQAYTTHFHEAAHFNLSPNKTMNDLISDFILTPFIGLRVKDYRLSHWDHHRFLGALNDTEISYHKPISITQTFEGLTGIYLIKTIIRYFKNFKNLDNRATSQDKKKSTNFIFALGIMLFLQLIMTVFLFIFISIPAAFTWIISVFVMCPFLAKLRQTLEHRSFASKKTVDYSVVEHGATNRVFGVDFFSAYFGGAGFNRHLLHHLDPTISYTCFDELEKFLLDTSMQKYIEANRNTYFKTFINLVKQ